MTTEPLEPAPPSQPEPAGRGPAAATVLAGALLVLVGVAWLLDANGVEVPWRAVLPAALIAVGLATAAGSMRGRQHGLMVLGLVLTLVLAVAVGTDWGLEVTLAGGVGDRVEEPTTAADLRDYRLAVGTLTVDLTRLQVPEGTTAVRARVGLGELVVRAPAGVAVRVDGRSGVGQVHGLDREENGLGNRLDTRSDDYDDASRRLLLELRAGIGEIRVERG
ncbi:MAG TPA: LiaF domain-containing protein [Actinomycetota bacterium]|nr:LiaF domain-containing protein [Actinomycetota bacterium]